MSDHNNESLGNKIKDVAGDIGTAIKNKVDDVKTSLQKLFQHGRE